ncbi:MULTISPECIES: PepSY domain-containing protein [Actinomycetes]|uniref:PepSY-associated TM helix domain-containing protein n=2 Tax=Actinomycetes TaxID=1760 RepID=A0ABP6M4R4_9MICC
MTNDIRAAEPARQHPSPPEPDEPVSRPAWFVPLLRRIHFYGGIFVGPFILIAALTGAIYAFSPQIERMVYSEELTASSKSTDYLPLDEQVAAAEEHVGEDAQLAAVRPAATPGDTTRVIYEYDESPSGLHDPQRGIFIDPVTGEVRGDEGVYGTGGSLPLRTEIAQMHRHLFLGDWGRLYSELAASWLAVIIIAGVGLWAARWRAVRRSKRKQKGMLLPENSARGLRRTRSWHAATGIWIAAGGLFLAATGITWSTYGGANVADLRTSMDWQTPSVETQLNPDAEDAGVHDEHPHHGHGGEQAHDTHAVDVSGIGHVLRAGREAGFTSAHVELIAASGEGEAWSMRDVSMKLPTPEIQAVAVDPATYKVTDVLAWDDYSFMAKLAQWGIWMHMGTLFGLANQILLFTLAVSIGLLVIWGYVMWWQRRPRHNPAQKVGNLPSRGSLRRAPWWGKALITAGLGLIAWFLPLLGVSLVAFILIDMLLALRQRRASASDSRLATTRSKP